MGGGLGPGGEVGIYLTWLRDPASTMLVSWVEQDGSAPARVWYRPSSGGEWLNADGEVVPVAKAKTWVRRVELAGLTPDTVEQQLKDDDPAVGRRAP